MINFLFALSPMNILIWCMILFSLILYLLGRYCFFAKIGVDGWKGLVPVYSSYLYYKKGNVIPWLSTLFICSYLVFYLFGEYCVVEQELFAITTFFKVTIFFVSLFVSWKVNYFISRKFKRGYLLTLFLTLMPIVAIPYVGLCNKIKWSRLTKVRDDFLISDFYDNRKVSVGEIYISNLVTILATFLSLYVIVYVFKTLFSAEKLLKLMWSPVFVICFVFFIVMIVLVGTLFDYFINKWYFNKKDKKTD